jgi:hypothetical protein
MKSLFYILPFFLSLCFSLNAEGQIRERAFVHTDKDCYIAGENILLKFYVIDGNFQPSGLSKVGYVEICDTEKPQMQLKVALEKGKGDGKIKIPNDVPSGIYQLSGYTRYMRNEGENVFFKKQIAIVNAGQQTLPDPKRFELTDNYEEIKTTEKDPATLLIKTNQNEYANRQKVLLALDNIPDNTADLMVSVSRDDSIAFVSESNRGEWVKQVTNIFPLSNQWIPEYEGHIITGHIVPHPQNEELLSSVAFVGKNIHYINGQINPSSDTVNFYSANIFNNQQIVTSITSPLYEKGPYRVDLLTPFDESLPGSLPVLQIFPNKKQLLERYIGVQIQDKMDNDSLKNPIQPFDFSTFEPVLSYDLDEYTRFSSVSETILEFILRVFVRKIDGARRIQVYLPESQRFSLTTLVLLDGIPVYNHEDILKYNPMYIKWINIYDGRYSFGGKNFECIVSFHTREGNLPFFQLSDESQLLNYDCPQLHPLFYTPDYSTDSLKNFRKPDFRHTLYWNPDIAITKDKPVNLSFYTSDLCGKFKVTVEGITSDGKIIHGISYFNVK